MEEKTLLIGIKQQVEEIKDKTTSKPMRVALNKLWEIILQTEQEIDLQITQLQEENNRLRRL